MLRQSAFGLPETGTMWTALTSQAPAFGSRSATRPSRSVRCGDLRLRVVVGERDHERARQAACPRRAGARAACRPPSSRTGSSPERARASGRARGRSRVAPAPPASMSDFAEREKSSREGFWLSPLFARAAITASRPSSFRYSSNFAASSDTWLSRLRYAIRPRPGCSTRTAPAGSSAARPAIGVSPGVGHEDESRDHRGVARQRVAAEIPGRRRAARRASSPRRGGTSRARSRSRGRRRGAASARRRGEKRAAPRHGATRLAVELHRPDALHAAALSGGAVRRVHASCPRPFHTSRTASSFPVRPLLPRNTRSPFFELARQVEYGRERRCGSRRARRASAPGPRPGPRAP